MYAFALHCGDFLTAAAYSNNIHKKRSKTSFYLIFTNDIYNITEKRTVKQLPTRIFHAKRLSNRVGCVNVLIVLE